jgi:hypothetical protein
MRRLALLLLIILPLVPARADALTLRDVMELTKAGLGDDVLVALIEVDRSVFSVDAETIKSLKKAGVSEKVIVALVRSGRTPAPQPEPTPGVVEQHGEERPADSQPQVIVIDHHDEPAVREVAVPVAVPIYVPVDGERGRSRHRSSRARVIRVTDPILPLSLQPQQPNLPIHLQPQRKTEPVYWGWGGKLRPDAWKPAPEK